MVAIGFGLPIWLAGPASAGGPLVSDARAGSRPYLDGRGSLLKDPRVPHRPRLGVKARKGTIVTPLVASDARPIAVPSVVLVPVPVVAAPPSSPEEAASPAPTAAAPPRPAVPNPGPKIIELAPPAPGARTVEVVVYRGTTTVVEKVPAP
jgi:hypothetical protein